MAEVFHTGQWQGFFKYGPDYGSMVEGKEAEFRLFVEKYEEGRFTGRIIDWEGFGADGEVATVEGFIDGDLISFTKQYDQRFVVDDLGNNSVEEGVPGHQVVYEGRLDWNTKVFSGHWEIVREVEHRPDLTVEEVMSGTWRMHCE